MRNLILLTLGLLLAASAAIAVGTTANVAWTAPTTYSDGTALPLTDIASYTITWSPNSPYAKPGTITAASSAGTATVTGLTCGTYNFTVTVTTTATAYSPNASATSSPVIYNTGITCVAPKPSTFTVTVT
jgi:hypothetical protein